MVGMILYFLPVIILIFGAISLLIRLVKKKEILNAIIVVLVIAGACYMSYGFGVKNMQVAYMRAYYEPTTLLISQLSDLTKSGNMLQVKERILYFEREINNINWRNLTEYRRLVYMNEAEHKKE